AFAMLSNPGNSNSGTISVSNGSLLIGADTPNAANGALGNSTSAVQLGQGAGTLNTELAGVASVTIGRPVFVNASTSGGKSIGSRAPAGNSVVFTGPITVNAPVSLFAGPNPTT